MSSPSAPGAAAAVSPARRSSRTSRRPRSSPPPSSPISSSSREAARRSRRSRPGAASSSPARTRTPSRSRATSARTACSCSDLVVLTMCEEPLATPAQVDAMRAAVAEVDPELPVVATVLRPRPVEPVAGRRVAFFSTAPEAIHDRLREHLEREHGAEVVLVSGNLAHREELRADLDSAAALEAERLPRRDQGGGDRRRRRGGRDARGSRSCSPTTRSCRWRGARPRRAGARAGRLDRRRPAGAR